MKYLEVRNIKKAGALGVLGVVALSPMLGVPQSAQAAPPAHAPAYGARRNGGGDFRNNSELRTRLRGTVVEDRDYSFVLRTDDGRRVLIQTGNVPANVNRGDRVTVRGFYTGDSFTARRVRVTDDDNWDWNDDWNDNDNWDDGYNRVTVRGIVTRDLWDNDEFEIRAENGRTYRVNTRRNQPRSISRGDRVEVIGDINGSVLRAESVRILSDSNGGWNGGWGNITLSGIVTRNLEGRRFEIRDNNGRTLQVIADSEPRNIARGDRVYITGRLERNVFRASTVSRNSPFEGSVGSRVNFPGVVTSIQSSTRFAVRGDNGRTYSVQLNQQLPKKIDVGDRIRVQGTVVYGGVVRANDVDLLDNYNKRDDRENEGRREVNISAVVTGSAWLGGLLTVRADNGQEYRVRTNIGQDLRRGDRVRIRGRLEGNGVIAATSITRY